MAGIGKMVSDAIRKADVGETAINVITKGDGRLGATFLCLRAMTMGAGFAYVAETEEYLHIPVVFVAPVTYGAYQMCRAGYKHQDQLKDQLTLLLNRWIK